MYVGITRARKTLYLLAGVKRRKDALEPELPVRAGSWAVFPPSGKHVDSTSRLVVVLSGWGASSALEVDELWHAYVREPRLEVACGEAPFIVSRYDPSVEFSPLVPIKERVGFLDRKLQVVSNQCSTVEDWIFWSKEAFKASYGYEWQGDNLLIGRENLLYSFIEHYREKFGEDPSLGQQEEIAEIVSWNLFQMDGLKCVIPMSCHSEYLGNDSNLTLELVEDIPTQPIEQVCDGCQSDLLLLHNGTYALIMDWEVQEPQRFVDLIAQPIAALPSW